MEEPDHGGGARGPDLHRPARADVRHRSRGGRSAERRGHVQRGRLHAHAPPSGGAARPADHPPGAPARQCQPPGARPDRRSAGRPAQRGAPGAQCRLLTPRPVSRPRCPPRTGRSCAARPARPRRRPRRRRCGRGRSAISEARTPGAMVEALPQTNDGRLLLQQVPDLVGAVEHRLLDVAAARRRARGRTRSPPGPAAAARSRASRRRRAGRSPGCGSRRTAASAATGTPWSRSAARSCRNPRNGRHPGARPDHDHRHVRVLRRPEGDARLADEGEHGAVLRELREVARADAGERAVAGARRCPQHPDGDAGSRGADQRRRARSSSSAAAAVAAGRGRPRTAPGSST